MFFRGLDMAIVYYLAQASVTAILQGLLFWHGFFRPVADVISSILLAVEQLAS